jgi:hypothetical protein
MANDETAHQWATLEEIDKQMVQERPLPPALQKIAHELAEITVSYFTQYAALLSSLAQFQRVQPDDQQHR